MEFTRHARTVSFAVVGAAALAGGLVQAGTVTSAKGAENASAAAPASAAPASVASPRWTQTWGAAPQRPTPGTEGNGPNWSMGGFKDQSLRQVIRVGEGGAKVRIRLSNRYGTAPLKVAGAAIARSAGGAQAWPGTARKVTFGGRGSATVAPGAELVGDPVALPTSPLERLAVTLRFTGATGPATFHRFTNQDAYAARGDHLSDEGGDAYTASTGALYYLTGAEVAGGTGKAGGGTVVAFGDSLVDGTGSTGDAAWPGVLAGRLAAAGRGTSVVNAGIAGNPLLTDSACYGDRGTARFRGDVLDRPGVRSVIVHLGANDIGASVMQDDCVRKREPVTARELIAGHRALIRAAHGRGIKIIGATVPPLKGALFPIWSPEGEKVRDEVNHWIRTGGEFDGVVDADRVMADPADPDRPRLGYVFQDGLHPNDAGHHAIARSVDLDAL